MKFVKVWRMLVILLFLMIVMIFIVREELEEEGDVVRDVPLIANV